MTSSFFNNLGNVFDNYLSTSEAQEHYFNWYPDGLFSATSLGNGTSVQEVNIEVQEAQFEGKQLSLQQVFAEPLLCLHAL